jgi:hypothetical protein
MEVNLIGEIIEKTKKIAAGAGEDLYSGYESLQGEIANIFGKTAPIIISAYVVYHGAHEDQKKILLDIEDIKAEYTKGNAAPPELVTYVGSKISCSADELAEEIGELYASEMQIFLENEEAKNPAIKKLLESIGQAAEIGAQGMMLKGLLKMSLVAKAAPLLAPILMYSLIKYDLPKIKTLPRDLINTGKEALRDIGLVSKETPTLDVPAVEASLQIRTHNQLRQNDIRFGREVDESFKVSEDQLPASVIDLIASQN